jgi:hypothetical protein
MINLVAELENKKTGSPKIVMGRYTMGDKGGKKYKEKSQ